MKDFAGTIAVVTGGGSGMGRELGDPDLSRGTESLQTRSLADGGTANTHKARSSDLGDSNPRSRIGAKLAHKQFLHGPVGWSIAESVQAAAAESAILIGRNAHGRLRATPPPSANPDRIARCTCRYNRAASD